MTDENPLPLIPTTNPEIVNSADIATSFVVPIKVPLSTEIGSLEI